MHRAVPGAIDPRRVKYFGEVFIVMESVGDEQMNQNPSGAKLRQFLLRVLDQDDSAEFEKLFISDPEWKQRILTAEEDLIEAYLEGTLSPAERKQFLTQYGDTARRQRRLQITKLVKEHAVAQGHGERGALPPKASLISRLWPLSLRVLIPVVAVLIIALTAGLILLVQFTRERVAEADHHAAVERELADLNSTAHQFEAPSPVASLIVPPVSVRGAAISNELTRTPDTRVIELRLLWTQKQQFPSYRAAIHRVGESQHFNVANLRLDTLPKGSAVRIWVPSRLLRSGQYVVEVTGVDASGKSGPTEEYTFVVNS